MPLNHTTGHLLLILGIALVSIFSYLRLFAQVHVDLAKKETQSNTTTVGANVLLAGAQKAGTSAMFAYLKKFPEVCHPKERPNLPYTEKETHFFDLYFDEGRSYYESLYSDCPPNATIRLDVTPDYLVWPDRIASFGNDFKIMLILREPVSREISWYNHLLREARQNADYRAQVYYPHSGARKTFETYMRESVLPTIENRTNYGLYADFVKIWLEKFDHVLILSYDQLRQNPRGALIQIHDFLGLPIINSTDFDIPRKNFRKVRNRDAIPCSIQDELAGLFEESNKALSAVLDTHGVGLQKFEYHCQET